MIAAAGVTSPLDQWVVAILCATGFVSLVIFYLSAGMNGMRYVRPAPLFVAIGCFVAIYLFYGNSVIGALTAPRSSR